MNPFDLYIILAGAGYLAHQSNKGKSSPSVESEHFREVLRRHWEEAHVDPELEAEVIAFVEDPKNTEEAWRMIQTGERYKEFWSYGNFIDTGKPRHIREFRPDKKTISDYPCHTPDGKLAYELNTKNPFKKHKLIQENERLANNRDAFVFKLMKNWYGKLPRKHVRWNSGYTIWGFKQLWKRDHVDIELQKKLEKDICDRSKYDEIWERIESFKTENGDFYKFVSGLQAFTYYHIDFKSPYNSISLWDKVGIERFPFETYKDSRYSTAVLDLLLATYGVFRDHEERYPQIRPPWDSFADKVTREAFWNSELREEARNYIKDTTG